MTTRFDRVSLMLGDCFKIFECMNNNWHDYVLTSPPYNRKRGDKYSNYADNVTNYFDFLCKFTDECLRVVKKHCFINIQSNYYNKQDVNKYIGRYADKIQQTIIWEKSNPMPANGNNITNAFEYIFVLGDSPLKSNFTYTKNHITTSVNSKTTHKKHKAVMNQEVSDWIIETFTQKGDMIFDPFMGLGTTAISCMKFERYCIGIEIDEEYYGIASERLSEMENLLKKERRLIDENKRFKN